jgi:ABC-type nitrate/sulfonate/bicarbonate transport system permease component
MSERSLSSAEDRPIGALGKTISKLGEPRTLGWIAVVLVLAVWEALVAVAHLNPIYLPRPSHILIALVTMIRSGGLLNDLLATLGRIFGGFAISLVLVGIWMATSERVNAIADNFIAALYPLPKVTLIPLLIIWLGTGGPFMLTISALGAIFPIIINTVLGIRQCDPGLILAARDLGANNRQIIHMVLLPSAVPSIFARLYLAGQVLETEQVFAVLIVLALLGIVVTKIQDLIDDWVSRWRVS